MPLNISDNCNVPHLEHDPLVLASATAKFVDNAGVHTRMPRHDRLPQNSSGQIVSVAVMNAEPSPRRGVALMAAVPKSSRQFGPVAYHFQGMPVFELLDS